MLPVLICIPNLNQQQNQQDKQSQQSEQQPSDQQQPDQQEQQEQTSQQPDQQKEMEAPDTTAQAILDEEKLRNEEKQKMRKGQYKPVDKDW